MFQPKWTLALALIDRAREWEVLARAVTADAGYGNSADFRIGLMDRQMPFVVDIQSTTGVWPDEGKLVSASPGCRCWPRLKPVAVGTPMSMGDLSRSWPPERRQRVMWREGTKGGDDEPFRCRRCPVQPQLPAWRPEGGRVNSYKNVTERRGATGCCLTYNVCRM